MSTEQNRDRTHDRPENTELPAPTSSEQHERRDPFGRHVDLKSLKVLAHPLRVRILDELSKFGPLTASGLADRLGESSGATSYHLRQLAKHDFVREVEGKGSGRERWWQRTPGGFSMDPLELTDTPAGREAMDLVNREFYRGQNDALLAFMARGFDVLSRDWVSASTTSTANVRMTADELEEFTARVYAVLDETYKAFRDRDVPPGARPVQVQFNAFPVIGGVEQQA